MWAGGAGALQTGRPGGNSEAGRLAAGAMWTGREVQFRQKQLHTRRLHGASTHSIGEELDKGSVRKMRRARGARGVGHSPSQNLAGVTEFKQNQQ